MTLVLVFVLGLVMGFVIAEIVEIQRDERREMRGIDRWERAHKALREMDVDDDGEYR